MGAAAVVVHPGSVLQGLAAKTFELQSIDYAVEPVVAGAQRTLYLDVRVEAVEERAAAYAREHPRSLRSRLGLTSVRGFQALFRVMHAVSRHSGRRILFSSDRHGALSGNLRLVHDRMVERGLDRELPSCRLCSSPASPRAAGSPTAFASRGSSPVPM